MPVHRGNDSLSIDDAENVGFERESQQMFQMIGAIDGWSGTWKGEDVELYQFENTEAINTEFFNNSAQQGNDSGWVDVCIVKNMGMLSKGDQACDELNGL